MVQNTLFYLETGAKGFCMGAADVVPGVSGGTMAFILGIYEDLLEAIRSFDLNFVRLLLRFRFREAFRRTAWRFLVALLAGIFLAIFSLAKLLSWLLHNQPVLIWSFFFGLILASVYTVGRHLQKWSAGLIPWIILGALGTYLLVGLMPVSAPHTPLFLFASGAVAICAMILPGISGAFVLVLLGQYAYVLEAVTKRDFLTLFLVAAGAGVGILSFARCLNWLLKKYHDPTMALLTGLMLGALRKVWPWKQTVEGILGDQGTAASLYQVNVFPSTWDMEVLVSLCLMGLGFFIVFIMNWCSSKEARS